MKIALAQLNYTIGDIDGNTNKIIDSISKAKEIGAGLVIFAEQAISGMPAYDLVRKTTFLELCEESLEKIATKCDTIAAIVGTPILTTTGTQSAAAIIEKSEIKHFVTKKDITARREMGFFVGGQGIETIEICGKKLAVVVGDDFSAVKEIDANVDTLISINGRRWGKGILTHRYEVMKSLAFTESKNIIIINQVGGAGEIVYDGTSGVIDMKGNLTLLMKSFEEDFQIYDTDIENSKVEIPQGVYSHDRTPLHFAAAVLGLRDYFHKNGYEKACIGLSGGIDSSVVACIAVEALGVENVRGILMPSSFSSTHSVTDARALAQNLGIKYNVLPINEAYLSIINTLKPVIGGTKFDFTEENIQARIRTIMLMAVQNKTGYVLLNSSNKSENALGLCTLYGDTAGAISVTGDLYKTEIYEMARYINRTKNNIIPENILTKEPSSELYPDQKDSDFLPPYDVVDAILIRMIEQGQHREEIVNAGFDSAVVEKIHNLIMHNDKKRYQFPPVLRLSACAFRHERLMPLINKYGD